MPRGVPGSGPYSKRGSQARTVKRNEHYLGYSKAEHPGYRATSGGKSNSKGK